MGSGTEIFAGPGEWQRKDETGEMVVVFPTSHNYRRTIEDVPEVEYTLAELDAYIGNIEIRFLQDATDEDTDVDLHFARRAREAYENAVVSLSIELQEPTVG